MGCAKTLVTLALVCVLPAAVPTGATSVSNDAGWDSRFGAPGLSNSVYVLRMSAGNVYAGGLFTTAGGANANRIAMWDNASWSALGTGVTGAVYAIAIDGNDVYVGGAFPTAGGGSANRIAKWDGSSWSALGSGVAGGDVWAIAISGTDVYVGGSFTTAGGTTALRVARWNGSSWSALGVGPSDDVNAIGIDGTNIYVGGAFFTVAGMGASRVAKWDGSSWSALGSGVNGTVNAIAARTEVKISARLDSNVFGHARDTSIATAFLILHFFLHFHRITPATMRENTQQCANVVSAQLLY